MERTRERSFLISTGVTLLILAGIIVVPKLLGSGSATFDVGLVGAASQRLQPALAAQAGSAGITVHVRSLASQADADAQVRDGKLDAAVVDGNQVAVKSQGDDRPNLLVQTASRTTRAQEELAARGLSGVLLAAVRPVQLLAGKAIGVGLVGLLQLLLIGVVGLAMAVTVKAITLPVGAFATFLPPTAPLILPIRMATGDIAAWQVAAALVIMLASTVAVVVLASRLYAGAILRTGARVKLRDAWRAARQPALRWS